jgi:hypothetical protein
MNVRDLFYQILWLNFRDIEQRVCFNNLFDETIIELDHETRKFVLYGLKLDIERRMRELAKDFEGFEKMRFRIRGHYDKIALESYCILCDSYLPIAVDLLEYRKRITDSYCEPSGIIFQKCPNCEMDGSLLISRVI